MKLHEFQAKALFAEAGLPVPRGRPATSPEDAAKAFAELGGPLAVVKAQIHAGGRGKAGGVKLVRSADEAKAVAASLLGKPLVTKQTGPGGTVVRRVLVEEGLPLDRELYAAVLLDRKLEAPILMASAQGGMEIEEVAAKDPKAIVKETIDARVGLLPFQARRMAFRLGLGKDLVNKAAAVLTGLVKVFLARDASLVEVNPLVTTKDGRVVCLDGKVTVDDNGLFRQATVNGMRDLDEEDPTERRAKDAGLSYIKLDGNIGCLVNGAGLAMATMDLVKLHGGEPANFLDVGGGATTEQVTDAFRIILEDPAVKGILVNIFGGILRCDVLAEGVVAATKAVGLKVPLVVRLEGTNVEKGREILRSSGLAIVPATDLTDAAQKIVEAVS
ncbi:MAG: ADP-forming succinate--CoA ligase subunit beta [Planctomycetes bacterium]|nr:ADP-forming succinate--CoA ligase subunit beta [Planctomycetota bacterium]